MPAEETLMKRPSLFPILSFFGLLLALWAAWAAADPEADYQRGLRAYSGDDLITAMEVLGRAADAGHPQAQALLGYIFDKAEDNAAAMRYYRMAADQGDPAGEYGVASLYFTGEGVEKDETEGVRWMSLAAERGYGPAIEVMAEAYLNGAFGLTPSREEALRLLRLGVEQGYEPARRRLSALEAGKVDE